MEGALVRFTSGDTNSVNAHRGRAEFKIGVQKVDKKKMPLYCALLIVGGIAGVLLTYIFPHLF